MKRHVARASHAGPLDLFVARLAAHPSVTGILLFGSTGTEAATPWSDHDLLVVFDELPAALRLVTTWVDGRLTEVYCTTAAAIRRIAAASELPASAEEGVVVEWLRSGRIAFDRVGLLEAARNAAPAIALLRPAGDEAHGAWRTVGYNVAQTKRIAAAGDPSSDLVVGMRLLYGLAEVMVAYFTARRLTWPGEKAAIRHWTDHDPDFLGLFRLALAEPDPRRKVEQYEAVARLAVAPVGALWEVGATMVAAGPGYATGAAPGAASDVEGAMAGWEALFGDGVKASHNGPSR